MLKISIDCGALANKGFGTYTVTKELIKALTQVDHINQYYLYLQKDWKAELPKNFTKQVLKPKFCWLKGRVTFEEVSKPKQFFVALNQAVPFYTPAKIIALSHGLTAFYYPQFYPDSAGKLKKQAQTILRKAQLVLVSSTVVKNSFNDIFKPDKKTLNKIRIFPYGIPQTFLKPIKKYSKKHVLLAVSMDHPIKNQTLIINSFLKLIQIPQYANYKLIFCGAKNKLFKHKQIIYQAYLNHTQLVYYYHEAQCLLTASFSESFNLPVLEALSQNTPVVGLKSAIVPELRPYTHLSQSNTQSFVQQIRKAIEKPKKINLTKLQKDFNWLSYAKELVKLYAQI